MTDGKQNAPANGRGVFLGQTYYESGEILTYLSGTVKFVCRSLITPVSPRQFWYRRSDLTFLY